MKRDFYQAKARCATNMARVGKERVVLRDLFSPYLRAVWRGSKEYLRHYIVQEGESNIWINQSITVTGHRQLQVDILDIPPGKRNNSFDHMGKRIWREVPYPKRIKSNADGGRDARNEDATFSNLNFTWSTRHSSKHYVIWRSDEFSWAERDIPRTTLFDPKPTNATELDLVIEQEMRSFNIPSISLCIYRQGKRVLSVSYGYSDLRTDTKANPINSYRIASISKTITAMGIAELINRRVLSLDARVFGLKGVLPSLDVSQAHPWLRFITIRHLLEHSSGGWSNMEKIEFNRTPQTKELNGTALLDFYIKSYSPKFQPGTRYLYSNVAYVMLGKIIEQISLRPYDQFIQDVILNPNKIEGRIGGVENGEFEVSYYSTDNANPYTYWTPSKLNAAAGWVMRAEEVARLFMLLESGKFSWYRMLTQPSSVKRSYGRGLQLGDDGSLFHLGSLAGSEGIGYSRRDLQVAILTNTRGREQGEHTAWMERLCRLFAKHIIIP
ncbi:hypothetical protein RB195_013548 [Necator americanus]|uniref:Beta-lactamase-related domain-containing protein n=1 Tax=Necator americanus TaxID=51031 RepID=A0ABR1DW12_NECAM